MSIEDWMPTMVTKLAQIPGLSAAGGNPHKVRYYADLPGRLLELPTMIVLTRRSPHVYSAGGPAVWVHQVQLTLYLANQVLPEAMAQAIPFIKLVRDKMAANLQLGGLTWSSGAVSHWLPLSDADFYEGPGRVSYAGTDGTESEFCGIIFHTELKEVETGVTVTP